MASLHSLPRAPLAATRRRVPIARFRRATAFKYSSLKPESARIKSRVRCLSLIVMTVPVSDECEVTDGHEVDAMSKLPATTSCRLNRRAGAPRLKKNHDQHVTLAHGHRDDRGGAHPHVIFSCRPWHQNKAPPAVAFLIAARRRQMCRASLACESCSV